MFNSCGIIHIDKDKISEEDMIELAIKMGAKDCIQKDSFHEIVTKKEDFYKIKTMLEKKIDNFSYSAIEWRPYNFLNLDKEKSQKMLEVLNALSDLDDVQNIFTNETLEN